MLMQTTQNSRTHSKMHWLNNMAAIEFALFPGVSLRKLPACCRRTLIYLAQPSIVPHLRFFNAQFNSVSSKPHSPIFSTTCTANNTSPQPVKFAFVKSHSTFRTQLCILLICFTKTLPKYIFVKNGLVSKISREVSLAVLSIDFSAP